MSIDPTLPLMFAQHMGPAARLANDLATHPEMAQNMSRVATEAVLKEAAQQVGSVEVGAKSSAVDDETGGNRQQFVPRRRKKPEPEEIVPEQPKSSPSSEGPFMGNLLNTKV